MRELALDDTAICRRCAEGLVVRSVRTNRIWAGPFWRLAWTHAAPQAGTDGQNCWAPYAEPDPSTIRLGVDYAKEAT